MIKTCHINSSLKIFNIIVSALTKERCKTPDSPEGARVVSQPLSPTQSSPQRPSANGTSSPINNGSADSLTPPPVVSGALSVSLETNQTQPYNHSSYTSCIARPLVKVKRFLSTLVQFGNDISPDIGERVRSLVLNLVHLTGTDVEVAHVYFHSRRFILSAVPVAVCTFTRSRNPRPGAFTIGTVGNIPVRRKPEHTWREKESLG
ncbi:mtg8 eto eight twenty one protein [Holotrichia oblita]|uniref:Mtg8 eto eight twenty one protein n=1 Tax=Holotrichia oblita TaxID=644536 RepID=A0ACB9TJX0_HOLOL|nr:mtg8 eto eight twenty one protein [Holotrichia oblita]